MKKNQYGEYIQEAIPTDSIRPIGMLRIGKITYDHVPIVPSSNGVSIGTMIDSHIRNVLETGTLVNEVTVFFETPEQQHQLRDIYNI